MPSKTMTSFSWLEYLWGEQLGRTSVQVLFEYYVNVTQKLAPGLTPDEAWDHVHAVRTVCCWVASQCAARLPSLSRRRSRHTRSHPGPPDGIQHAGDPRLPPAESSAPALA